MIVYPRSVTDVVALAMSTVVDIACRVGEAIVDLGGDEG